MTKDRITIDEKVCNGKPTIRGMGITVATILEFMLSGDSWQTILDNYSLLEYEDLEACAAYAMDAVSHQHTIQLVPISH